MCSELEAGGESTLKRKVVPRLWQDVYGDQYS